MFYSTGPRLCCQNKARDKRHSGLEGKIDTLHNMVQRNDTQQKTFSKMTLSKMTFSKMTLRLITLNRMTPSTISLMHNNTQCNYA
jgi:hypothetical protein